MAIVNQGGGTGTVTNVSSANNSITVATGTTTAVLTVGSVDKLFTNNAPAAALAMNTQKLTGLAAGSGAGDSLRYEQLFTAGAVPIADIADPTTGKVIGSASNAAAAVFPPGYEFGYDQITGSVTIASTTEGTPTTVITCAAHTFDGAPVLLTFYAGRWSNPGTGNDVILLVEGGTSLGRIGWTTAGTTEAVICQYRFTPTAASHTYVIAAFGTLAGTGSVLAGAGGATNEIPAFVRFTKV